MFHSHTEQLWMESALRPCCDPSTVEIGISLRQRVMHPILTLCRPHRMKRTLRMKLIWVTI